MKASAVFKTLVCCLCFKVCQLAAPEQGIYKRTLTKTDNSLYIVKTLYRDSIVKVAIVGKDKKCASTEAIEVFWQVRSSSCFGAFSAPSSEWQNHNTNLKINGNQHTTDDKIYCDKNNILHCHNDWKNITVEPTTKPPTTEAKPDEKKNTQKREVGDPPARSYYLFYLFTTNIHSDDAYEVTIELKSPVGYLSAHEYPLLTFYMCMCIAYIIYALLWLVMCACNYRDLLRVQFWIGGVILLGMIEKAVFYSEFLSVDQTGISVIGAAKFAEIVSALKRTLARMLVIIVSLGFGIVKPRLGPMLHRIIVVGGLYFVLAVVEAMIRNDSSLHDPNNRAVILAFIPLAILDAVICWWVFMSLLQTMKTLRLRRNTTKLSLYRHFSNAIIFCVLASIIMIIWSWRVHSVRCMVDWPQLWMETAFWHLLFSVILFVIMILWRPTANNQRYAYSPMVDGNDSDEDEEPMLSGGARETVKMRGGKKFERSGGDKTEEDLKWIEENIPQTIADVALPMLESDDEDEITTKYEMSKME
uniref:Transmembrane protein 87A n=1 Tax=Ciona intestinalis TaxID=7719 RepID=H2XRS4_CIOIN